MVIGVSTIDVWNKSLPFFKMGYRTSNTHELVGVACVGVLCQAGMKRPSMRYRLVDTPIATTVN